MSGMFLKILVKCHGLFHHPFVQLGGIEQVQTVLTPDGKSQMGNIQAFLVARNGNDVAIVNRFPQELGIPNGRLGYKTPFSACQRLFLPTNVVHPFRMRLQRLVLLWMATHEVYVNVLYCREWRIRLLYLRDDLHL